MKFKSLITISIIILLISIALVLYRSTTASVQARESVRFWDFQSIDTMKYSRDYSREKLRDPSFDIVIERQIKAIAETGATHVGIATPYDEEFYPMLERWVTIARKYHLKVWFRGNFAGWEGWFEYPEISRAEHIQKTQNFIVSHPGIFENGDIFSACPECENGGPGDPRQTGDVKGHRAFLIKEHKAAQKAFKKIGKKVSTDYNSMNGDVARLVMDDATTQQLGGIVVIDHYVKDPEQLNEDIHEIAKNSGGKVVLGEYGAPIPDIHGKMSEIEQSEWLSNAFPLLIQNTDLVGLNYWVNVGGSTQLWTEEGTPKAGVEVITRAYKPHVISGVVKSDTGNVLSNVEITDGIRSTISLDDGSFSLPSWETEATLKVSGDGYKTQEIKGKSDSINLIVLAHSNPSFKDNVSKIYFKLKFFDIDL